MAARIYRGLVYGALGVLGVGLVGAYAAPEAASGFVGMLGWHKKEPEIKAEAKAFDVTVGQEPEKPEPPKTPPKEERIADVVKVEREKPKSGGSPKPPSLTDKWLKVVNEGGMLDFGKEITDARGGLAADGGCSILQPVRVRAMIADAATTDQPGLAIGMTTEPVQGEEMGGTYCVAIPAGSVVGYMVATAGEYATNRAPVTVEAMWLPDGHKIDVGQPAKWVDGIPGPVGEANHHVAGKTFAAVVGSLFRIVDNVTSIGQFGGSVSTATDPFEDMIRKKFNQPAEISLAKGRPVEFDVMPTSTPGY